jgi:hypothetical protein
VLTHKQLALTFRTTGIGIHCGNSRSRGRGYLHRPSSRWRRARLVGRASSQLHDTYSSTIASYEVLALVVVPTFVGDLHQVEWIQGTQTEGSAILYRWNVNTRGEQGTIESRSLPSCIAERMDKGDENCPSTPSLQVMFRGHSISILLLSPR